MPKPDKYSQMRQIETAISKARELGPDELDYISGQLTRLSIELRQQAARARGTSPAAEEPGD